MASPVREPTLWSSEMQHIHGLTARALDRARMSRDPRFDGKFFIAVTSTRIYCRPICPSPHARRQHVRYFATAAAATAAGFRPCLRCRPEAAPGTPAWLGTSAVVGRALRMIEDGFLDRRSVEELAARLGLGARHLDRLFVQHVGAPPVSMAHTRRLHFAKRLLDETHLPITDIAFAAGFNSVRRFNSAFHQSFRRPPRDFRRQRHERPVSHQDEMVLRLTYRPPYDWEHVHAFLAARSVPGIELVDGNAYMRTVATDAGFAVVHVSPVHGEDALELRVTGATPSSLLQISSTARRMFDVAADPSVISAAFRDDELLGPLVRRRPGLRIPGVWVSIRVCRSRRGRSADQRSWRAHARGAPGSVLRVVHPFTISAHLLISHPSAVSRGRSARSGTDTSSCGGTAKPRESRRGGHTRLASSAGACLACSYGTARHRRVDCAICWLAGVRGAGCVSRVRSGLAPCGRRP